MDHVTEVSACVICHSERLLPFESTGGKRLVCLNCHHAWRTTHNDFDQAAANMRPVLNMNRLQDQRDYIAPYVVNQARVLEIGCATGDFARLARTTLPIATYDAFELSSAGELAKPDVDRLFVSPLEEVVQRGDIQPNTYDLVIMSQVLEHFPDPVEAVGTISRIMSERAHFFLEIPNGSGHVGLSFDDNPAHPHFYSVSSIVRLLDAAGLHCVSLTTGVRTEARYSDSIRVIARRFRPPQINPKLFDPDDALNNVIVWCCGITTYDIIPNDFDLNKVRFFVDKNAALWGRKLFGKEIKSPEEIVNHPDSPILISSINVHEEIEKDIRRMFQGKPLPRIVRIGDLLDDLETAVRS